MMLSQKKVAIIVAFPIIIFIGIITYGIILQLNYPFTHFPISDSLRDSLKWQTSVIIEQTGVYGTLYLTSVVPANIFILMSFQYGAAKHYSGAVNKTEKEGYEMANFLRRFRFLHSIILYTISIAGIIDDIFFNCPEELSLAEFARARLSHNLLTYAVPSLFGIAITALVVFLIAMVVIKVCGIRTSTSGLRRVQSDEELGTADEAVSLDSNQEVMKVPLLEDEFVGPAHHHPQRVRMIFNQNKIAAMIIALMTIIFIVATYGVILQLNYPFTHLPISDSLRDSLKQQTSTIIEEGGIYGIFVLISAVILSITEYAGTFNDFKPKEWSNTSKHLERLSLFGSIFVGFICIAGIIDDIVFHCPEDMPLAEFAWARLGRNLFFFLVASTLDMAVAVVLLWIAIAVLKLRKYRAARRLRLGQSDEELGSEAVVSDSKQEVPLLKAGIEQKTNQEIDEKDAEKSAKD
ncbi:hypothetical protein K435DRAFT_966845 [Dendrothele bispora CBS 962.96]|uniref:Uncharacterized protein n=1 Tax=Dendrothele bispora (strain CBS 962.96) TaxID=1314807 RepID=A0A4S8LXQ4_DENBC|nr:hypothetical protein K435DRAFT_966845 [Dendrothele bispora CBS 962.96]